MPTKIIKRERLVYDFEANGWGSSKPKDQSPQKALSPEETLKRELESAQAALASLHEDYNKLHLSYLKASKKEREYNSLEAIYKQREKQYEVTQTCLAETQGKLDVLHQETDMLVQKSISFEVDTAELNKKLGLKNVYFKQLLGYFHWRIGRNHVLTSSEINSILSIIQKGMSTK